MPARWAYIAEKFRIGWLALAILVADQTSKAFVLGRMDFGHEWVVVEGFFKFVLWGNTGAAWSLFHGQNNILAGVSILALIALFFTKHHFDAHTLPGQIALGLMFGGIIGNLIDRVRFGQVIDFIRFYMNPRGGGEIGFPAFNVADTAICTGVGLLFLLSWQARPHPQERALTGS